MAEPWEQTSLSRKYTWCSLHFDATFCDWLLHTVLAPWVSKRSPVLMFCLFIHLLWRMGLPTLPQHVHFSYAFQHHLSLEHFIHDNNFEHAYPCTSVLHNSSSELSWKRRWWILSSVFLRKLSVIWQNISSQKFQQAQNATWLVVREAICVISFIYGQNDDLVTTALKMTPLPITF